jgi:MFS transporter, OFA family, oxalate/formate antiporter
VSAVGWLLFRDDPEQCGLRMDGAPRPHTEQEAAREFDTVHHEFTHGEAVRTLAFWAFSLALGAHGLAITALTFHVAALGREMGLSAAGVYSVFWPMSFFSITSNIAGGWIGDRARLKFLLIVMMAAHFAGTAGLYHMHHPAGRALLIAGYGTAGGLFVNLVTVVWPRYYGRKHLGAISGLNMSIMVFASALGPLLFSTIQAATGEFRHAILAWLAVPLALLVLATRADNPQRRFQR